MLVVLARVFLRLPGLANVVEILADLLENQFSEPFTYSRVQFSITCNEDNFTEMLATCAVSLLDKYRIGWNFAYATILL